MNALIITCVLLFLVILYMIFNKKVHTPYWMQSSAGTTSYEYRLIPAWYNSSSSDSYFVHAQYRLNRRKWKTIAKAYEPIFANEDWHYSEYAINANKRQEEIDREIEENFSTYEKLLAFQEKQREKLRVGQEKINRKRSQRNARINNILNKHS